MSNRKYNETHLQVGHVGEFLLGFGMPFLKIGGFLNINVVFKIAVGGVFVFDWFKIRMRICWCTLRNWTWC